MRRPIQTEIFIETNHGMIVNNGGKRTEMQNVRLDADDMRWLDDVATAVSSATGNSKYGRSTVANEAIRFYRQFYSVRNKLVRHWKTIEALLQTLP